MDDYKSELGMVSNVKWGDLELYYIEIDNTLEEIKKGWPLFESKFKSLKNRKMMAITKDEIGIGKVRLCSTIIDSENLDDLGFNKMILPAGDYIRVRIKEQPPKLYSKVGNGFKQLIEKYKDIINWDQYSVEYYHSYNIIDCMVPIDENKQA